MPRATFHSATEVYQADTCAPLRKAADDGTIELWSYGRGSYPGRRLPREVLPRLRSVGLWEATSDQDWGLDWHRNEGIEFTCVTGGRTSFSCEGEDFDLPTGSITITRPWQPHRVGTPDITASSLCWFIVDVGVRRPNQEWQWPSWLPIPDSDLARITELLRHNERPVWPSNKQILRAVERLERTLRGEVSQPLARIALYISEILLEVADLLEQQQPVLDPYLSSSQRMVELFLRGLGDRLDEPWTVSGMAAECGIGKTRFVHYCRQIVNLPPLEYVTELRLRQATELLRTSDAKVSDIAFECGFQSSQYFATVFRRQTGHTPSDFRARSLPLDGAGRLAADVEHDAVDFPYLVGDPGRDPLE